MKNTLLLISLFFSLHVFSQPFAPREQYLVDSLDLKEIDLDEKEIIDSCIAVYHSATNDTAKLSAIHHLIWKKTSSNVWTKYNQWRYSYLDSIINKEKIEDGYRYYMKKAYADAMNLIGDELRYKGKAKASVPYHERALKINQEIGYTKGIGYSYNEMGLAYVDLGEFKKGKASYEKAEAEYQKLNNKAGLASVYSNLGYVYSQYGDVTKAIEYDLKSLRLKEEMGNLSAQSVALNNLGAVFFNQGNTEEALKYFQQSMEIDLKLNNDLDAAMGLNNIGAIHHYKKDYTNAIKCFRQAMVIYEKYDDQFGIAMCLNNLGGNLFDIDSTREGVSALRRSLTIFQQLDNKVWLAYTYNKLGTLQNKLNHVDSALFYSSRGLALAEEIGHIENIRRSSETLYKVFEKRGESEKALKMYKQFITMRDSIANTKNERATIQQQTNYEYEKQKAIDDKENEKLVAIEKEKQHRQYIITLFTVGGAAIIAVLLLIIYRRLRITRSQKIIIEEQKEEVEAQRDEIENQKELVEKQRDDIVDSITYAKRIQEALLKNEEHENTSMPSHFILYQPKDIVSGDFYWTLEKQHYRYIAAVDCTGHGVPGAFLTMLGTSFLNEINSSTEVLSPAEILNKLRTKIIKELAHDGDYKDGMDISMLRLNAKTNEAEWAGANNPFYMLRKDASEIEIIRGDKEPIGFTENPTPFSNHNLTLNSGDLLYLFTDGYPDQFGGEEGKKLGYKAFRDKIVETSHHGMSTQKETLETFFEQWKQHEEQVDDVCIIGVKI